MIKRRIVKYEFVMNEEEFKVLMAVCDPNEFLYGYTTEGNWRNGNEKTKVTMTERILDEVEAELERYIAEIDTAFDSIFVCWISMVAGCSSTSSTIISSTSSKPSLMKSP